MNKIWGSIKRNPVINAFMAAVLFQLTQDYLAHEINWAHFAGYFATLCLGVIARGFTVPLSKHEDLKDEMRYGGE